MDLTVIPAKKQLRKKRYSVKLLNGTLTVLKNDSNRPCSIAGDFYSLAAGGQLGCSNEFANDYTMDWWSSQHDLQLGRELSYKRDAKRKRRNDSGFSELSENFSDDEHEPKVEFNKQSSHACACCETSIDPSIWAKGERGETSPSSLPYEDGGLHGSHGAVTNTACGLPFDRLDVRRENLRAVNESGDGRPEVELLAEVNAKMPWVIGNFRASVSLNDGFCMGVSKESCPEKRGLVYERLHEVFQLIKMSLKQFRTYV